jgi:hypothetical protein
MVKRSAVEIAGLLEEIGRRAAFEDGNPYKAKAYVRAAASLRRLARPLEELVSEGALQTIPGVGTAIAKRIEALYRGEVDEPLERMRQRLPAGLLELQTIPGLRPKNILKLHQLLGVKDLEDLTAACREGRGAATRRWASDPAVQDSTVASVMCRSCESLLMCSARSFKDEDIGFSPVWPMTTSPPANLLRDCKGIGTTGPCARLWPHTHARRLIWKRSRSFLKKR